jgi:hypothetical protein
MRIVAAGGLAVAAVLVLSTVHHFALTRFFTVDEYQWGHATWLVSVGQVPYRDFYEHHFPLGYILHSWLLPNQASFIERALMLRHIAYAYALLGCASVAVAEYIATRNVLAAASFVIVPISVGFGLMSAIDYRGDNWSAFVLVCCFSVLRANQSSRRRWLAATAGVLSALALLMTQKTVMLGGVALFVMIAVSLGRRWAPRWVRGQAWLSSLEIHHPGTFAIAAAVPLLMALAAGAGAGILGQAFEITIEQAWQHERLYPGFSAWKYFEPYLAYAPLSTAALVACALGYAALSPERFWVLPTAAAVLGGLSPKAPFPYNFVLASFLVGVCAVRGYTEALRYLARSWPRLEHVTALGYLIPLLLIPTQLGFVRRTTTNESQLETLRLIEAHTTAEDIVIDNEGGALFRPHRSYYWYHGMAHVQMFRDYYEHAFVEDLRASRAIFWLNTLRTGQLPAAPRRYLESHYVRVHGDLYVLGFELSPSLADHPPQQTLDVVRAGDYFLGCATTAAALPAAPSGAESRWLIDGELINGGSIHLDPGLHRVESEAPAPGCRLTYLPGAAFHDPDDVGRHAPLFEYTSAW